MKFHDISRNYTWLHGISWKWCLLRPRPQNLLNSYRISIDSGGLLHHKMHRNHKNMRNFMDFTYFHESLWNSRKFMSSCEFRILEWRSPPEPLKYHRFPIDFAVGGAEGPMFMRIHEVMWTSHNSTGITNLQKFNRIHTILPKWVPFRPRRSKSLL